MQITVPKILEIEINALADIVTNGLFAVRGADVMLTGTQNGVKITT